MTLHTCSRALESTSVYFWIPHCSWDHFSEEWFPAPITSFTLFVGPGPGNTAAQIWPGKLLLGALLFLAYEPQQQLAILSCPIKANFCVCVCVRLNMGLRILGISSFYVFVLSYDK